MRPNIYFGNFISISIKFEKKYLFEILLEEDFLGGGSLTPFFFFTDLLVRVKLGYTPNFTFLSHWESWLYNQLSSARLACLSWAWQLLQSLILAIVSKNECFKDIQNTVGEFKGHMLHSQNDMEKTIRGADWPKRNKNILREGDFLQDIEQMKLLVFQLLTRSRVPTGKA